MILPGTYANGFAPRDGRPLYESLWKGCVGAWNPGLGVTGLTLRDQSRFQNTGTLTNGPTWAASSGKYALSFDGTNDHVIVSHAQSFVVSRLTLAAWLYVNTNTNNDAYFGKTTSTSWNDGFGLDTYYTTGKLNFWVNGYNTGNARDANTIQLGKWFHVSGTYDGAAVKIYIDGKETGSRAYSTAISNSSQVLTFGQMSDAAYNCDGNTDDIRIYNRALSAQEIRTLATRRGIAYELAPRRRSSSAVTTNRRRRIIIGGNR